MKRDHAERLIAELDGSGSDAEWAAVAELRELGQELPALLLQQYRSAKKAGSRSSCVYHATRYARENEEAVLLGIEALGDRAKNVRYRACMLLAYALRRDTLPALRQVAEDEVLAASKDDFEAAIDAIEHQNSNFFVDRKHTGNITLNVH